MQQNTKSFFHGIQSMFSAKYHGRYLALILIEIGKHHPDCLIDFFAHTTRLTKRSFSSPRFETEYAFEGSKGHRRRADVAVFAKYQDIEPLLLIEVKYFDKPIEANGLKPAQLDDYVAWTEGSSDRHFVALCREQLLHDDVVAVRWGTLAKHLKSHAKKSELVQLLVDYLQQEGNTMQDIEPTALIKFMKRLVCPPWGSGVLANNVRGPTEFGKLQLNMKYIAGAFDPVFKGIWKAAGKKAVGDDYSTNSKAATIDFDVVQSVKSTNSEKLFGASEMYLRNSQRNGGQVSVFAQYSLGHGQADWLRVVFGVYFDVVPNSKLEDEPATYAYAQVTGAKPSRAGGDSLFVRKKVLLSSVTNKAEDFQEKIEKNFCALLAQVLEKASVQKPSLTKQQNAAIRRFAAAFQTK